MIPTTVLVRLATLGLSKEQAEAVGAMLNDVETATRQASEAVVEQSRAKTRARVQKWRENKEETLRNVTNHSETLRNGSREGVTRGEDNLQSKNQDGQEERKKPAAPKALSDLDAFRADLAQDCPPEQVEAFIKHRKSKKGQNSAYSAKLFRKDAEACGLSVSQAIDTAISRGWLTVKPEYLAGKGAPKQATAPPRKPNAVDAYEQIARERGWTNEPELLPGLDGNAKRVSAEFGGPAGTVVDLRAGAFRRVRSGDF